MRDSYITDISKVISQLSRFVSFVQKMDGREGYISFRDSTGILGREEDYKSRIAEEARKELDFKKWNESWIGTGKIAECARRAMNKASNLVDKNQQVDFKNRIDSTHADYRPKAERALYDVYCNRECSESDALTELINVFGAKYDTISFLFFIKDDTRFLPVSPGHFDKSFSILGIDYETSYKCGWENYIGFIQIIDEIRTLMEALLPMQSVPRLIDAHSFVWVIQEDKFIDWNPDDLQVAQIEQTSEIYLDGIVSGKGGRRTVTSNVYARSSEVVKETKKRAKGVCQLCKCKAPFNDKNGNPYLEVHHVIWLSRGGADSTDNTVALCPNCHTKMHVLDIPADVDVLVSIINQIST